MASWFFPGRWGSPTATYLTAFTGIFLRGNETTSKGLAAFRNETIDIHFVICDASNHKNPLSEFAIV